MHYSFCRAKHENKMSLETHLSLTRFSGSRCKNEVQCSACWLGIHIYRSETEKAKLARGRVLTVGQAYRALARFMGSSNYMAWAFRRGMTDWDFLSLLQSVPRFSPCWTVFVLVWWCFLQLAHSEGVQSWRPTLGCTPRSWTMRPFYLSTPAIICPAKLHLFCVSFVSQWLTDPGSQSRLWNTDFHFTLILQWSSQKFVINEIGMKWWKEMTGCMTY